MGCKPRLGRIVAEVVMKSNTYNCERHGYETVKDVLGSTFEQFEINIRLKALGELQNMLEMRQV